MVVPQGRGFFVFQAEDGIRDTLVAGVQTCALPIFQYLLGWEDFHGLRLAVSPDVLVLRPETEGLVEWALEVAAGRPEPVVADLGTGSGAIACAIARSEPTAEVLAVEISGGALAVASRNVRDLKLGARVRLLAGDLFAPLGSIP